MTFAHYAIFFLWSVQNQRICAWINFFPVLLPSLWIPVKYIGSAPRVQSSFSEVLPHSGKSCLHKLNNSNLQFAVAVITKWKSCTATQLRVDKKTRYKENILKFLFNVFLDICLNFIHSEITDSVDKEAYR